MTLKCGLSDGANVVNSRPPLRLVVISAKDEWFSFCYSGVNGKYCFLKEQKWMVLSRMTRLQAVFHHSPLFQRKQLLLLCYFFLCYSSFHKKNTAESAKNENRSCLVSAAFKIEIAPSVWNSWILTDQWRCQLYEGSSLNRRELPV